jgi:hypothetical protein
MSLENDLTMMHIIILELCPLKMIDHDAYYYSRVMSLEHYLTMMHIIILELCPLKMI